MNMPFLFPASPYFALFKWSVSSMDSCAEPEEQFPMECGCLHVHGSTALSWVQCLSTHSTPTQLSPASIKASDSLWDHSAGLSRSGGHLHPWLHPAHSHLFACVHMCAPGIIIDCSLSTAKDSYYFLNPVAVFQCSPAAYTQPGP